MGVVEEVEEDQPTGTDGYSRTLEHTLSSRLPQFFISYFFYYKNKSWDY